MANNVDFWRVCKERDEWRERAEEMAERLDERYKAGFDDGWLKAAAAAIDMMPYPLDADGEPIRIGDVMEHAGYVREVVAIGKNCFFAWSDDDRRFHQYSASRFLHHAQEDVEDVLREMLDEHHRWFDGEGERTVGEMVADCAGRLQLREA